MWQGKPKKWWKLPNRTIKIWGKKFYWENLCGVAHTRRAAGTGGTGTQSGWQYRQDGLKLVYCMAVCRLGWQYIARRRNGCIAWFSLNAAQTYKSKTNVLDVYNPFLVSLCIQVFTSFEDVFPFIRYAPLPINKRFCRPYPLQTLRSNHAHSF